MMMRKQVRGSARSPAATSATMTILLLNLLAGPIQAGHLSPMFDQVEPFDEHQLPAAQRTGEPEPGLGRVMKLKTYIGPKSSLSMSTAFHIYTRNSFTRNIKFRARQPELLAREGQTSLDPEQHFQYNLAMLAESGFNVSHRTVVMIPGYLSEDEEQWAREGMRNFLELHRDDEGVNVVLVSWTDSNRCVYSQAVAHTVLVARQVTVMLHYLAQLGGTNLRDQQFLDRLHLIGHSLGAHISGFVGQDLAGRLGRITGLDPAGPSFDSFERNERLDRNDARLVEVLHTNAGRMRYIKALLGVPLHKLTSMLFEDYNMLSKTGESTAWFGIQEHIGHIDYYANDGRTQEGCDSPTHICDHGRAGEIYVDLLKYETYMRDRVLMAPAQAHKLNRLWAFRSLSYRHFTSGVDLNRSCPQLLEARSHLNQLEVALHQSKCMVPLIDFVTPLNELIRELRDQFQVNFEPEADPDGQPEFYFRTHNSTEQAPHLLVGDHWLLKVYLDPSATRWNENLCSLSAHMHMLDGQKMNLQVGSLIPEQRRILVSPFVHPHGARGHAQLLELLELVPGSEQLAQLEFALPASSEATKLFVELFPSTVTLSLKSETGAGNSDCQLAVQRVEVHPIGLATPNNVGALYGGLPRVLADEPLRVTTTGELADELAAGSYATTIVRAGHMSSLGVGLESVLVDGD